MKTPSDIVTDLIAGGLLVVGIVLLVLILAEQT